MKITVLGCGTQNTAMNHNSNYLLEEDYCGVSRKMLFDCGWSIIPALSQVDLTLKDVDDIYISHIHADHCGGLEMVAYDRYDWVNKTQSAIQRTSCFAPSLYFNSNLCADLWNHLKGGLALEGFDADIDTFFDVKPINDNLLYGFKWQGWTCKPIREFHTVDNIKYKLVYGLIMSKIGHNTVYFTSDSIGGNVEEYKQSDIIIHDCETLGYDCVKDKVEFKSGVHAHYVDLARLSGDIKRKMWLTHYSDFVLDGLDQFGNECYWEEMAKNDGFNGFVTIGQEIIA